MGVETYNFTKGEVYCLETNNMFVSDIILSNDAFDSEKTVVINSLSRNTKVYLLPPYRDKNKRGLKKVGLHPKIGTCELDFLKFVIDREIDDYQFIIFGLAAMTFEGVDFLKDYLRLKIKGKDKVAVLIDYDPKYREKVILLK
ncbi:hypothetical protein GCM10007424_16080 [Flavobacterium suaedae]|uniref:IPExxxVDY family protein n=1 Tax=Flavobacterium suaedae TaxID=1767027 RepID=A0ABQ1JU00_9FLAO|nr:hypothetical protein [Flavobacterium suaedae]GGB76831.1 hypothetical protein GCM10007424_16080 [Flavobacterium suaedae]